MLQVQNHFVEPTEKAVHQFRIIFDTIEGSRVRMVPMKPSRILSASCNSDKSRESGGRSRKIRS